MNTCTAALALVAGCAMAWSALANPASRTDMVEHVFGATPIHAVSGHGRMAIGVSQDGDLTTLVWPNPSYCDQLAMVTSNATDARSKPRFGAPNGSGLFIGLQVTHQSAAAPQLVWLHDPQWFTVEQDYGKGDGANIETRFHSDELGLNVTVTDAVDPARDVLVRSVVVQKAGPKFAALHELRVYANLSPQPPNSKLPELPLADWGLDGRNDFAAVWSDASKAVVHFHPKDQLVYAKLTDVLAPQVNYGTLGTLLAKGQVSDGEAQKIAPGLDDLYAAGTYLALTTQPPPSAHHIGYDRADFCGAIGQLIDNVIGLPKQFPGFVLPMDPGALEVLRCPSDRVPPDVALGFKHQAIDAYSAATLTTLPGSNAAAGEVDEVLATPLAWNGDSAKAAVILAAAATAKEAQQLLADTGDGGKVADAAEKALANFLAKARVPKNSDPEIVAVAKRALINIRVGTEAATGAIVASIARQPPYGLDWPRDGAFFELLLDVSGQKELAEKRAALSASWQRQNPVGPTALIDPPPFADPRTGKSSEFPAGAWEMNYYADGIAGGNIRFEIDNTAFALWSLCTHGYWTGDAKASFAAHWPTIEKAAELLADWKDAKTGLQAPAQEDDNAPPTQTLHGAVTVAGALEQAARAADVAGKPEQAKKWRARAQEIQQAIADHLFDAKTGLFAQADNASSNPGSAGSGPTGWLVWPMRVFPWTDKRVQAQLAADFAALLPLVQMQNPDGGAYFLKNLLSTALALGQDKVWRPKIQEALGKVARLSTKGSHHFGEVMVPVTDAAGTHADQRVATPHLWEGALFYLTAMALEEPAALQKDRPQAAAAPAAVKGSQSGGCQSAPGGTWFGWAGAVSLLWLIFRRRRAV